VTAWTLKSGRFGDLQARAGGERLCLLRRIWFEPDSAVGGEQKLKEHGGWREVVRKELGNGMIQAVLKGMCVPGGC